MTHYLQACDAAAADEAAFAVFKCNPSYAGIVQNVNITQGRDCIAGVTKLWPELVRSDRLTTLLEVDLHGSPRLDKLFDDARPLMSPTLARYLKEAATMRVAFGERLLNECTIVEIGIGYAGLRTVLHDCFRPAHAFLIDLPQACGLARAALTKLSNGKELLERTTFVTTHDLEKNTAPAQRLRAALRATNTKRLVISNYALSECDEAIRKSYVLEIVNRCQFGYLTINHLDTAARSALFTLLLLTPNSATATPTSANETKHSDETRELTFGQDVTGGNNVLVLIHPAGHKPEPLTPPRRPITRRTIPRITP
jgi:hypothetical protein